MGVRALDGSIKWQLEVAQAGMEQKRVCEVKAVTVGSGAGGGHARPEIVGSQIESRLRLLNPFRSLVRRMKDSHGQYLSQLGLVAGQPPTLFGHPIALTGAMPAMTSKRQRLDARASQVLRPRDRRRMRLHPRGAEAALAHGDSTFERAAP